MAHPPAWWLEIPPGTEYDGETPKMGTLRSGSAPPVNPPHSRVWSVSRRHHLCMVDGMACNKGSDKVSSAC